MTFERTETQEVSLEFTSSFWLRVLQGHVADQAEYASLTGLRRSEFGAAEAHETESRIANIALGLKKLRTNIIQFQGLV